MLTGYYWFFVMRFTCETAQEAIHIAAHQFHNSDITEFSITNNFQNVTLSQKFFDQNLTINAVKMVLFVGKSKHKFYV